MLGIATRNVSTWPLKEMKYQTTNWHSLTPHTLKLILHVGTWSEIWGKELPICCSLNHLLRQYWKKGLYLAYLLISWCWRQQRRVSSNYLLDWFRMLGGIAEKSTLATKTIRWEVECSKETPWNKFGVYCSKNSQVMLIEVKIFIALAN